MKKIIVVAVALGAFLSCQEQQKIGFVDNGEIINEYQEKKDLEERFKIKNEAFTKKRDSIGQAFQLEYGAFQKKAQRLSQRQQQEQSGALNQKAQFLQQQLQVEQQQLQQAFQTEIDSIISKVDTFVSDYGKKNNYSYILGKNEAGSVMFGEEKSDLTKTIIKALNADSKTEDTKTEEKE